MIRDMKGLVQGNATELVEVFGLDFRGGKDSLL